MVLLAPGSLPDFGAIFSLADDETVVFPWQLSANTAAVSDAGVLYALVIVGSPGSLSVTS